MISFDQDKKYSNIITQNIINNLADSDIRVFTNNKTKDPIEPEYNLLVTVGSQYAINALNNTENSTPILSLLIPELTALQLENKHNKVWATQIIDQPYKRQLSLIKHVFGKKAKVGILLGPSSSKIKKKIIQAASETNIKVNFKIVDNADQLIPSLKETIRLNDVLLAIPDPVVYNKNSIRGILLLSYRNKTPVIGFSKSYIKAGATTGLYSTPEQIANDATNHIKQFFKNNKNFDKNRYYPKNFSIDINQRVADSLRLNIEIKNVNQKLNREAKSE